MIWKKVNLSFRKRFCWTRLHGPLAVTAILGISADNFFSHVLVTLRRLHVAIEKEVRAWRRTIIRKENTIPEHFTRSWSPCQLSVLINLHLHAKKVDFLSSSILNKKCLLTDLGEFFSNRQNLVETINYSKSAKIRPQAKIDNFAFKNSNIIIEGLFWKREDYFTWKTFEKQ